MAFDYDSYLNFVTPRESGGDPNAQNASSSASGLYQFIDPTYIAYARRLNPGVSEGALMAQKNDPAMQQAVMREFTNDNVKTLTNNGIDVNNGTVYAAHFLGPQGAVRAFGASDDTPISQVVDASAIKANPAVFKNVKTVGDFKAWAAGPSASGSSTAPGQHTSPMPDPDAANKPAPGAMDAAFAGGQPGANGFYTPGTAGAAQQSPWDKLTNFMTGGKPWSLSDALQGVSIAAMARDNPQAAAALAQGYAAMAKQQGGISMVPGSFNKATGTAVFTDGKGNTMQKPIASPYKELSSKDADEFMKRDAAITDYNNILNQANYFRDQLAQRNIDYSPVANAARKLRTATGTATEDDLIANQADQFFQSLNNANLRQNKGTQTEGDAQRGYAEVVGQGYNNTAQMMKSMDRVSDMTRGYITRERQSQDAVLKGGYANVPAGDYGQRYDTWQQSHDNWEKQFAPVRESWMKEHTAQPQTGTVPSKGGSTSSGSLPKPDKDGVIRHNGIIIRPLP